MRRLKDFSSRDIPFMRHFRVFLLHISSALGISSKTDEVRRENSLFKTRVRVGLSEYSLSLLSPIFFFFSGPVFSLLLETLSAAD